MLRVIAKGEQGYILETVDGKAIGWVGAHVIGFRLFDSEREAIEAAPAAWETLQTALGWPPDLRIISRRTATPDLPATAGAVGELRITQDGAYDWIARGNVPLARLHRMAPPVSSASHVGTHGAAYAIEFVLPSSTSEAVAINAAQSMYNLLQRRMAPPVSPRRAKAAQPFLDAS